MSIPRAIFQVWVGPKPLPDREAAWCAEMALMNPQWTHRLCGNELLTTYASDPYIQAMQARGMALAFITDRLRVLLLRDHGGVYLDADCQPVKPLDSLPIWDRADLDFVAGLRSPHRNNVALHRAIPLVDDTFLASVKGGRIISRIASLWNPGRIVIDGHDIGCDILENCDASVILLNQRYIYAMEQFPETLVLHDKLNLGSWAKPKNFLATHGLAQR